MYRLSLWDKLKMWFDYNIWYWIIDAPMSNIHGHCTGRRSKKEVYCPDCDGE